MISSNVGALQITYIIIFWGGPYYNYNTMGPETLFSLLRPLDYSRQLASEWLAHARCLCNSEPDLGRCGEGTHRLQYPLIKEYTKIYSRILNMTYGLMVYSLIRHSGVSG